MHCYVFIQRYYQTIVQKVLRVADKSSLYKIERLFFLLLGKYVPSDFRLSMDIPANTIMALSLKRLSFLSSFG